MRWLLEKISLGRSEVQGPETEAPFAQNRTTNVNVEVNVAKCIRNACFGFATILLAIGVLNGTVELPSAAEMLSTRSFEHGR